MHNLTVQIYSNLMEINIYLLIDLMYKSMQYI